MPQYLGHALNPGLSQNKNMAYHRMWVYFIKPCATSYASEQYFWVKIWYKNTRSKEKNNRETQPKISSFAWHNKCFCKRASMYFRLNWKKVAKKADCLLTGDKSLSLNITKKLSVFWASSSTLKCIEKTIIHRGSTLSHCSQSAFVQYTGPETC